MHSVTALNWLACQQCQKESMPEVKKVLEIDTFFCHILAQWHCTWGRVCEWFGVPALLMEIWGIWGPIYHYRWIKLVVKTFQPCCTMQNDKLLCVNDGFRDAEQGVQAKRTRNWQPLSIVIWAGMPKRLIQLFISVCATSAAEIPRTGMASGHRVNLSTQVKRYRKPGDGDRGPKMSMRMWLKWASGPEEVSERSREECRYSVERWECWYWRRSFAHFQTSVLIPGQMKCDVRMRCVACIPG